MLSRRVLIIEDDADAAGVLEAYLRRENYDVTITGDGLSGLDMAQRWKPDLILLDVMLPGLNGTEVLAGLRRKSDVPVIMVTAMGDTPDRIGALRYGADDYVVKPYHPGEVVARVQAVLRRSSKKETEEEILRWQTLEVDVAAIVASVDNGDDAPVMLDLTPTEFRFWQRCCARLRTRFPASIYWSTVCRKAKRWSAWWIPIFITCVKNSRRRVFPACWSTFAAWATGSDSHDKKPALLSVALDLRASWRWPSAA
jgi:DNA-binding response OmpR family regulator